MNNAIQKLDSMKEDFRSITRELATLQTVADVAFMFSIVGAATCSFFLAAALGL